MCFWYTLLKRIIMLTTLVTSVFLASFQPSTALTADEVHKAFPEYYSMDVLHEPKVQNLWELYSTKKREVIYVKANKNGKPVIITSYQYSSLKNLVDKSEEILKKNGYQDWRFASHIDGPNQEFFYVNPELTQAIRIQFTSDGLISSSNPFPINQVKDIMTKHYLTNYCGDTIEDSQKCKAVITDSIDEYVKNKKK